MGFLDKMRSGEPAAKTVRDPVCGMTIDPARAAGKTERNGSTTYFCSTSCKTRFDADPAKFGA